ncbi:MAG: hypothetical protein IKR80_00730 [Spirochaetales bacterium]|nr:hypothetical protein [Spirochaetales bacterium]
MENTKEPKVLLKVTSLEAGVSVECSVHGPEEMMRLVEAMATVADNDPMIMLGLLMSLKRMVNETPEEKEKRREDIVDMPDFSKMFNSKNNS